MRNFVLRYTYLSTAFSNFDGDKKLSISVLESSKSVLLFLDWMSIVDGKNKLINE